MRKFCEVYVQCRNSLAMNSFLSLYITTSCSETGDERLYSILHTLYWTCRYGAASVGLYEWYQRESVKSFGSG